MKQLAFAFFILCVNIIFAQENVYKLSLSDDFKLRQGISLAIGESWSTEDYAIGEISGDNQSDVIVIANSETVDDAKRKIFLFVNLGKNEFQIAATNENIIECRQCGGMGVGDPYQNTVINNNYFSFEQLFGAGCKDSIIVTFKYDKKRKSWFLHKDTVETYCNEVDKNGGIKSKISEPNKKDYGIKKFEDY